MLVSYTDEPWNLIEEGEGRNDLRWSDDDDRYTSSLQRIFTSAKDDFQELAFQVRSMQRAMRRLDKHRAEGLFIKPLQKFLIDTETTFFHGDDLIRRAHAELNVLVRWSYGFIVNKSEVPKNQMDHIRALKLEKKVIYSPERDGPTPPYKCGPKFFSTMPSDLLPGNTRHFVEG